jgi:hypothetical protein
MKRVSVFAIIMLMATIAAEAQTPSQRCVTSGSFTWGYNATWSGAIKSGSPCNASFSSGAGVFLSHRIVSRPSNGTLAVAVQGNNVPRFTYQPKAGFSGSDSFTIELNGAAVNRQTGTQNAPANTQITYQLTVSP